jgi:dolichol-phosphate mannosyltransferase
MEIRPDLTILLATLNERSALPGLMQGIKALNLQRVELVFVDDGSTDGTREFLTDLAKEDPSVRVIFHEGRRTLSVAHNEGLEAAKGEVVLVMDSDLQHPIEAIPRILERLGSEADLVVASRYTPGGSPGRRPALRAVTSRVAELTAKLLLPEARRVRDPLSGFFAFRRNAFPTTFNLIRGYKLLLLLLAMSRPGRVVEVPYDFRLRVNGSSKIFRGVKFVPTFLSEVLVARRLSSSYRLGLESRIGRTAVSTIDNRDQP